MSLTEKIEQLDLALMKIIWEYLVVEFLIVFGNSKRLQIWDPDTNRIIGCEIERQWDHPLLVHSGIEQGDPGEMYYIPQSSLPTQTFFTKQQDTIVFQLHRIPFPNYEVRISIRNIITGYKTFVSHPLRGVLSLPSQTLPRKSFENKQRFGEWYYWYSYKYDALLALKITNGANASASPLREEIFPFIIFENINPPHTFMIGSFAIYQNRLFFGFQPEKLQIVALNVNDEQYPLNRSTPFHLQAAPFRGTYVSFHVLNQCLYTLTAIGANDNETRVLHRWDETFQTWNETSKFEWVHCESLTTTIN